MFMIGSFPACLTHMSIAPDDDVPKQKTHGLGAVSFAYSFRVAASARRAR
jgi:hypothetical protein